MLSSLLSLPRNPYFQTSIVNMLRHERPFRTCRQHLVGYLKILQQATAISTLPWSVCLFGYKYCGLIWRPFSLLVSVAVVAVIWRYGIGRARQENRLKQLAQLKIRAIPPAQLPDKHQVTRAEFIDVECAGRLQPRSPIGVKAFTRQISRRLMISIR